ncbi:Beta-galactoside-binding lectin 14 kDa lectin Electrolectin [Channa argus]|uniref:Galectin n=1 Tax=Channa argus TaxID=215402 RepID=A0A6G1PW07_CHAAH|nr:Beta-galactoside-binding lectin 14 kDa lectin Electrolectin [Channa argus]
MLKTTFRAGQTLTIGGVPTLKAEDFSVNICTDDNNIALHVNPRFQYHDDKKKVVFNSCQGGSWEQEIREGEFPFFHGTEFKIVIKFNGKDFVVTFSDGTNVVFLNRIGLEEYPFINIHGDCSITSFNIV